jgi:hypothetical protein
MTGGYFVYDLLDMWYLGTLDFDMFLHHMLCIVGMAAVIITDVGSGFAGRSLFITEVSNPPMHFRVILRIIGLRYSRAYEVAEFAYFILFFIGRMLIGHPNVYNILLCEPMNILSKIFAVGILVQSYLFLYRMYFIVNARFKEIAERKRLGL